MIDQIFFLSFLQLILDLILQAITSDLALVDQFNSLMNIFSFQEIWLQSSFSQLLMLKPEQIDMGTTIPQLSDQCLPYIHLPLMAHLFQILFQIYLLILSFQKHYSLSSFSLRMRSFFIDCCFVEMLSSNYEVLDLDYSQIDQS